MHPFGNLGANFTFNVTSGLPYTAIGIADNYSYLQGFNGETPLGTLNSDRMPWRTNLDAQITKGFKVGPVDMTAYLWVLNVFQHQGCYQCVGDDGISRYRRLVVDDSGQGCCGPAWRDFREVV